LALVVPVLAFTLLLAVIVAMYYTGRRVLRAVFSHQGRSHG
jgi:hypothetical protein